MKDGFAVSYAADYENNRKAANAARKIAYMESIPEFENLLLKPKEKNEKVSTLLYKPEEKAEVFQIAQVFAVDVVDIGADSVLLECKLTERKNDELVVLLKSRFKRISVVRGGAVAIESISTKCR